MSIQLEAIGIRNFKAIEDKTTVNLAPLTLLTGVNSIGKTTIMQSLLLIKQTVEDNNIDSPLKLNGPYVSLGTYQDIITNHDVKKSLGYSLHFKTDSLKGHDTNGFEINVEFNYISKKIVVSHFSVKVYLTESDEPLEISFNRMSGQKKYKATYNSYFFEDRSPKKNEKIIFDNPKNINITIRHSFAFIPFVDDLDTNLFFRFYHYLRLVFKSICYIGPLRQEPKKFYSFDEDLPLGVGKAGEATAHSLSKAIKKKFSYKKFNTDTNRYEDTRETLLRAVNFWLCKEFEMAEQIHAKKNGQNLIHQILLTYSSGSHSKEVNIKDVGFGISQILPIIVQGLLLEKDSILILEQPEIHLHPKAQSKMADFLLSMALSGKKIIFETHSDHLITRLRRRIVELEDIEKEINIYFVERLENGTSETTLIEMNKYGVFNKWPRGFYSDSDSEMKAIIVAQNKKRRNERGV